MQKSWVQTSNSRRIAHFRPLPRKSAGLTSADGHPPDESPTGHRVIRGSPNAEPGRAVDSVEVSVERHVPGTELEKHRTVPS